jgi:hypothetical protein
MPPKSKAEDAPDAAKVAATTKLVATSSAATAAQPSPADSTATTGEPVGAGVQALETTHADAAALPSTPVGAGVAETAAADVVQADAEAQAAAPITDDGPYVVVVGPVRGRRRIGRSFGREPVRIPMSELSDNDIKCLIEDETLAVSPFRR